MLNDVLRILNSITDYDIMFTADYTSTIKKENISKTFSACTDDAGALVFSYKILLMNDSNSVLHEIAGLRLGDSDFWRVNRNVLDVQSNEFRISDNKNINDLDIYYRNFNNIVVKESELSEEWHFQLSTWYNIPEYEDIVLFSDLVKKQKDVYCIRLFYKDEHAIEFLNLVLEYMNEKARLLYN